MNRVRVLCCVSVVALCFHLPPLATPARADGPVALPVKPPRELPAPKRLPAQPKAPAATVVKQPSQAIPAPKAALPPNAGESSKLPPALKAPAKGGEPRRLPAFVGKQPVGTNASGTAAKTSVKVSAPRKAPGLPNPQAGDDPLGGKIGVRKGSPSSKIPIGGLPSRPTKPSEPAKAPKSKVAVPLDPGARPGLATFEKDADRLPKLVDGQNAGGGGSSTLPGRGDQRSFFKKLREGIFGSATNAGVKEVEEGDTRFGSKSSLIGQGGSRSGGTTGSTIAPSSFDDEGLRAGDGGKTAERFKGTALGEAGTAIGKGLPSTPTGKALQQAVDEIDDLSTKTHTSKDGVVTTTKKADGTIIVSNKENGTTTTLKPDGSTVTVETATGKVIDSTKPTTSVPDPDNENPPLPEEVQEQIEAEVAKLREIGPKQIDGAIDPTEEGDPTSGTDPAAKAPDKKHLIVNPGSPEVGSLPRSSLDQEAPLPGGDPDETDPERD